MKKAILYLALAVWITTVGRALDNVTDTNAEKHAEHLPDWKLEGRATIVLTDTNDVAGLAINSITNKEETIMSMDGTVFTGQIKDGRPHGQGLLSSPSGTRQQGQWRNGQEFQVAGRLVYPDGTVEIGTWNRDGSKSGGTIVWSNGKSYEGEWKLKSGSMSELPNGKGTMRWPDGRVYVGQFEDGLMEGRGKMTYSNGKIEEGIWKLGQYGGPVPPR